MEKLVIGSFKRVGEPGSFQHYFTHTTEDGREVCLEACTAGYCVGIYKDENIIGEKTCTNIKGMQDDLLTKGFSIKSGEALMKAVDIANEKLDV